MTRCDRQHLIGGPTAAHSRNVLTHKTRLSCSKRGPLNDSLEGSCSAGRVGRPPARAAATGRSPVTGTRPWRRHHWVYFSVSGTLSTPDEGPGRMSLWPPNCPHRRDQRKRSGAQGVPPRAGAVRASAEDSAGDGRSKLQRYLVLPPSGGSPMMAGAGAGAKLISHSWPQKCTRHPEAGACCGRKCRKSDITSDAARHAANSVLAVWNAFLPPEKRLPRSIFGVTGGLLWREVNFGMLCAVWTVASDRRLRPAPPHLFQSLRGQ
jgi:hypothetical protein